MTPRKRKATESAKGASPAKRASKGRAAKKQDDPVWATENANSHLVSRDLHAEYCDPKTYESWTKEDWEEIHDCLPENAPFNDDGYSVQITYFKYDPDWRRLVREFQEDLGAGRYEPQWQKEAAQAMEERAAGNFDKHKEDQFEAFWGQKQKLKAEDRAGESAKIKLPDLVEAGRIKVGDDLSFRRAFEKKGEGVEGRWMIEKDIKVVAIDGSSLTVAIPPGQMRYPKARDWTSLSQQRSMQSVEDEVGEGVVAPLDKPRPNGVRAEENTYQNQFNDLSETDAKKSHQNGTCAMPKLEHEQLENSALGTSQSRQLRPPLINDTSAHISGLESPPPSNLVPEGVRQAETYLDRITEATGSQEVISEADKHLASTSEKLDAQVVKEDDPSPKNLEMNQLVRQDRAATCDHETDYVDSETGCILHQIKTIKTFVDKIIEIDGRLCPKDAPILSNWRLIRLQRNNQDLGSLFDLREELHIWKSPTTVKMPKKESKIREVRVGDKTLERSKRQSQEEGKASMMKRASDESPRSNRASKRSKGIGVVAAKGHPDEDQADKSDGNVAIDRDSDGDFEATESKSMKSNPKPKSKRKSGPLGASSNHADDVREDESKGRKTAEDKRGVQKTHMCPHCGNGYTQLGSLNRHINTSCSGISKSGAG